MSPNHTWTLILLGAIVLRVGLMMVPHLSEFLMGRIELSSPTSGYTRLTEGLFLLNDGRSPYAGDVFHQPPLLILAFWPLQTMPKWVTGAVFILRDAMTAHFLREIARYYDGFDQRLQHAPAMLRFLPNLVAAGFLFNPLTLLSCVAFSGAGFTHCMIAAAIAYAIKGRTLSATWALAVASYLDVYPVILLAPITLLLREHAHPPVPIIPIPVQSSKGVAE